MLSHPPDTFVVGGACGTLGCTRNSFRYLTSLLLIIYPFTSDQGVANVYRSTLLLSMVITQNLDVSGGTFSFCPTFLSLSVSGIFLSVRHCRQRCPLGIFSSFDLFHWRCPLIIFYSSDLYVVPYSGEYCRWYKLCWISNHDACCGNISANVIALIHYYLDRC